MNRRIGSWAVLILLVVIVWPSAQAEGSALRVQDGASDLSSLTQESRPQAGPYGYTGASTNDTLAIFDLTTWALSGTLSLLPEGDYPYDATMKPDGSEVWIPGAVGDGVVVIDTATNQVSQHITVGNYNIGVAFRQDSAYAFVSSRDNDDVAVIDTSTYAVVDTIPIPVAYQGPGNLALNPCGGEIYLVNWYYSHLFVLDAEAFTVTQDIPLGANLWQVVVHPRGDYVYVTDRGPDVVYVLDTATMGTVATVPVGTDPWGIDITPDGTLIYTANEDSHDVTAIDATNNTVITTISLPHGSDSDPRDIDFDITGTYAYVTSGSVTGDDEIYVIDTSSHTVVGRINVAPASNPNVVAVAPQMAGCGGLSASKRAEPEPVVLGDPLTYTIAYLYTEPTPTLALVTDTLPAGTTYLTSSGGLGSSYDPVEHQVTWDLGTVPGGAMGELGVVVLPEDTGLPGQAIVNRADLAFDPLAATVWATSTIVTPELAIRFPDGSDPPDPLPACAGELITLTAVSNRSTPLTYTWDLGDGSAADTPEVSHSWSYGTYTVTLTTTNPFGWVERDTLVLEVGRAPIAGFTSNSPVQLGQPARFTDTSAFTPVAWLWDFGDGLGTSDQPNPVYTYTNAGLYTVTLTVTNACGMDLRADLFEVEAPPCQPVEAVTITGPLTPVVGQPQVYTATYAPPTATLPVTITWDNGAVGPAITLTWIIPGTYALHVTATNPCGEAEGVLTVTVACQPLNAVTIDGPLSLEVGQEGLYTATYAPITATLPVSVTWDNGAFGAAAVYSWTTPGTYTITVSATNPCGVVVEGTQSIEVVEPACSPVETVTVSGPLAVEVGQVALYTATYAPPTATAPVTLTWDNDTVGATAIYSWTTPGTYTVTVTAVNPCSQIQGVAVVQVRPAPFRIYLPLLTRGWSGQRSRTDQLFAGWRPCLTGRSAVL